ncbi:MAG: Gfo/Idh/MocA family oxidoreductase [Tepidisphaeraceae bacterium]
MTQQTTSRRGFLKTSAAASAAVAAVGCMNVPAVHAAGDDKIKIGLIGCGGRGRGACGNAIEAAKNVQVIAIGDLFPDRIAETKELFKDRPKEKFDLGDRAFSGWDAYKKVLETDANYIITATPPAFRPMIIEASVNAGKHVFGEKPFGVDPVSCRKILVSAEKAKEKGIGVLAGAQRRHHRGYMEVIKRIHDGAIGQILAMQGYWLDQELWSKLRQPEWSDLEFQLRNWLYYTWLSGDHIVEQHLHQIDVACWVMGGPPKYCFGVGGRQARTDPQFGYIYDHFAIEYEFPNGAKFNSMCRQTNNTMSRISEHVFGAKGHATCERMIEMYGEKAPLYKYQPPEDEETNPYVLEHKDFIDSIRAGKPLNEGKECCESTLAAIMGRMAAYTGKLVTWKHVSVDSKESLIPEKLEFGPFPVPPVAIPGKTPLL